MKLLLVTEKLNPNTTHRDGGARLIDTLIRSFKRSISIMQFGGQPHPKAIWQFDYPVGLNNHFEQRISNAAFIARKIKA